MRRLLYLGLLGLLLFIAVTGWAASPYELFISPSVTQGYTPLTVNFNAVVQIIIPPQDGADSETPLNSATKAGDSSLGSTGYFLWNFGDGSASKSVGTVSHIYKNSGSFTVTCKYIVNNATMCGNSVTINVYTPSYSITYNGNGNTSGSVPVDSNLYSQGQTVTVLGNTGNLGKPGATFMGWSLYPEGGDPVYTAGQTFIMGAGSVTFYAQWKATAVNYIETGSFSLWPGATSGAQLIDMKINPANGMLLVAILGPTNNPYLTGIDQYDLYGSYIRRVVNYGASNGYLPWVRAITVDAAGNIYAADGNGYIHKFNANGSFISKWSGVANSLAIDNNANMLYALDSGGLNNNTVRVYDLNGNLIRQWSAMGRSTNIAINNSGNIYLATLMNGFSYMLYYNIYGTYLGGLGQPGYGDGQFFGLFDLTFDPDGFLYTVEYDNYRVQKFDLRFGFLCKIAPAKMTGYGLEQICEYQGKLYVAIVHGYDMVPYQVNVYTPY